MPVDLFWVTAGFVIGVVATALALEVAFRRVRNEDRATLTRDWDLEHLAREDPPSIVATSLDGVKVPPGSRIVVAPGAALPRSVVKDCELRVHAGARGNFAVGSGGAVLCSGPIARGTLALSTFHPALVKQLAQAFDGLWLQAKPYTFKVSPSEIASNVGGYVEVEGTVSDVLQAGDVALVTLATAGARGGGTVVVPARLGLEKGKGYRFKGTVVTEGTRVAVKAEHVQELPAAAR